MPTFELKKVSYNKSLSEETNAFTADIYVDGKMAGLASNRGHGGNTDTSLQYLTDSKRAEINAWIKAQPPKPFSYETGGKTVHSSIPFTLESIVDDLMEKWLDEKYGAAAQEKKWVAKSCCFRLKGDPSDSCRTLKSPKGVKFVYTKAHKKFITDKYGDKIELILNEKHGQVPV